MLLLPLVALLALPLASVQAGWRIGIGIGIPPYPYYRPYRVVVVPGPVYVGPPAPVYVQPAPVYYYPQPTYVQPAPVYVQPVPQFPEQPQREVLPPPTQGR
jgi:hypothetical protein